MEKVNEQVVKLPHAPGVYIYKDKSDKIIYVGKAKDLRNRVGQYFRPDKGIDPKTSALIAQIQKVETIPTVCEFDAILLEAKLISTLKPKYNVAARDDKSPLYVIISLQKSKPGVLTRRGRDLTDINRQTDTTFGPFQSGRTTRMLLRSIRRIIPYCTQKRLNGRPCFYTQIGLCNPCPSEFMHGQLSEQLEKWRIYKRNLHRIKKIFSGKAYSVKTELINEMRRLGEHERFEEAAMIRNQLQELDNLLQQKYDPQLYISEESFLINKTDEEKAALKNVLKHFMPPGNLKRIECVDISNTGGRQMTGSLVVLTDGIPNNGEYRRFRIRSKTNPDDVGAMREVLGRRFKHREWKFPDLLVVDGGRGQVRMATDVITELGLNLPILGLAKRREEIILYVDGDFKVIRLPLDNPAIHLLQRVRDEAHRFGLNYHRTLRKKAFLQP